MKYISVIILLVLMSWTWSLATAGHSQGLEQSRHVEAGVENDVRAFIQRRYPETANIYCQQLYTEIVQADVELVAHFRCRAVGDMDADNPTDQVFQGWIRLKSEDNFRTWNEVGGEINAPEIRFLKDTKITPRTNEKGFTPIESEDDEK